MGVVMKKLDALAYNDYLNKNLKPVIEVPDFDELAWIIAANSTIYKQDDVITDLLIMEYITNEEYDTLKKLVAEKLKEQINEWFKYSRNVWWH